MTSNQILIGAGLILVLAVGGAPAPEAGDTIISRGPAPVAQATDGWPGP